MNPAQAHQFAKALLKRAKTDAIDVQTLAQLAMVSQPEPWTLPPPIDHALQQRLVQRDDLLNLRQQVDNQLHALRQHPKVVPEVRARMERLLATFEGQLTEVEAEITTALRQDSAWAAAAQRLQSITSVGWVTATWTLVSTLNCATCQQLTPSPPLLGWHPCPGNPAQACGIAPRSGIPETVASGPRSIWRPCVRCSITPSLRPSIPVYAWPGNQRKSPHVPLPGGWCILLGRS
jgi:hypothetical protein